MALLFQNTTKLMIENNSGDNYDAFQQRNQLSNEKNRERRRNAVIIAVAGLIVYSIRLAAFGLRLTVRGIFVFFLIFSAIGTVIGEIIISKKYKNYQPAGQANSFREIKYSFMEDKVLITENFNSHSIDYGQITRITQDNLYYYIYTSFDKLTVFKGGFTADPKQFELIMNSRGFTIGNDR